VVQDEEVSLTPDSMHDRMWEPCREPRGVGERYEPVGIAVPPCTEARISA